VSLTEKQVAEYRKKLKDKKYIEKAISGIAEKFLAGDAAARLPCAEPEINNTEEKEMARNKWQDLNDHLFEQIEWLTDRSIKGEELTEEIKRTESVVKISEQILKSFDLYHKAALSVAEYGGKLKLPAMIEDKSR
jgi:hypothetical protein